MSAMALSLGVDPSFRAAPGSFEAARRGENGGHRGVMIMDISHVAQSLPHASRTSWPILICLLGDFQLLKSGCAISVRGGGKTEALLCYLGVHYNQRVPRETLLNVLWSNGDPILAGQSLNSL